MTLLRSYFVLLPCRLWLLLKLVVLRSERRLRRSVILVCIEVVEAKVVEILTLLKRLLR